MDRTAASCYIYAKASGMLAKSFTGSRLINLFSVKTLQELWGLLFTDEVPAVPQTVLAQEIEKKASEKFVKEYTKLLSAYSKPDEILLTLLQSFDYENLKNAAGALATGNSKDVHFYDISPFNILNYSKFPEIDKMTSGTELSWFQKVPLVSEEQNYAARLDNQFIKKIWAATKKLPGAERKVVEDIIAKRYVMMNILWAMRLKVYYNMDADKIAGLLIYFDERKSRSDIFAKDALAILDYKIDDFEQWASWKYRELVNDTDDVKFWKLDPQKIEENVQKEFARSMKCEFHKHPFTSMVLVTWFYIKSAELDNIRKATEAIRLNIDSEQLIKELN